MNYKYRASLVLKIGSLAPKTPKELKAPKLVRKLALCLSLSIVTLTVLVLPPTARGQTYPTMPYRSDVINGSTAPSSQNTQDVVNIELQRVEIPEIQGSINVPTSWSIVTFFEAKESVKNVEFLNEEAQEIAMQAAQNIGSTSFKVAKESEPYNGLNYSLTVAWSPVDASQLGNVPLEARSEVSKRVIENQMIPKIKSLSRDFSIMEVPTQIDSKGSGAWVTYKEKVIKKDSSDDSQLEGNLITRLYLLTKPNYFVIVTLSFPEYDDPKRAKVNKDILGEMLKSFQVQNN